MMEVTDRNGITHAVSGGVWEKVAEFRWFTESQHKPPRLQQASRCRDNGKVSWHDVPLVYEPLA
jgi:hypothetical protein